MLHGKEQFFEKLTDIQTFYGQSTILITGGTGFVGKLLVEKLLRCCRHVKMIYLIIRTKKGQSPEERLTNLLKGKAFENVHIYNENYKNQVRAIKGDLEEDGMGISEEDKAKIIEEVELVFHLGANVRFDLPLKKMANSNVKSTREMIKLAHEMKNLKLFTHVSTAYSFCHKLNIHEKIYDVPMTPAAFMKMVDKMSEEELENKSAEIIGEWHNSYVFTKAIAEHAVLKEGKGLPRAIVRPSIVVSANKEPHIGWTDTIFGPTGLTVLCALGIVHVILANKNACVDYIPVDFVVNHILAVAYYSVEKNPSLTNNKNNDDIKIYTCGSSKRNPINIGRHTEWFQLFGPALYSTRQIGPTWVINTSSVQLFQILHYILHVPPAFLLDIILQCFGKRPLAMRNMGRLMNISKSVMKFSSQSMMFHDDNTQDMINNLSLIDQEIFYCDIKKLCWHGFSYNCLVGGRKFLLKEKLTVQTFDKGIKWGHMLQKIHYIFIAIFCYFVYRIILLLNLF